MRERTTWSRAEIAKTAFGRTAEDPRAMNQDHLKQQPAADAYTIGGPSEFGEDVHPSTGTWKVEQKGGETARNEIGMPEMRRDTFNHPEKTASALDEEALLKKADLAAKVARSMLSKKASEAAIEDQALALMHMPDAALVETANRLAAQDEEKEADDQGQNDQGQKQAKDANDEEQAQGQQDQGQKQAKDANDDESQQGQSQQSQGQSQGQKQGGQIPEAFKENIQKMKDKAKDKDDKKEQGQGKEASAGDQFVQALKLGDGQGIQSALQQMMAGVLQQMSQQQGQQQTQQAQQQTQQAQQQTQQQPMAQQVQQQMAQGQGQQQPMAQQQQMAEDQLLDQMLQDELGQPGQMMMADGVEPEIQMEASSMDVGEVQLGEADAVLSTLFASNPEYQNAAEASQIQGGGQPVTAGQGMGRTASTRTVGTRPSNGVSQIGGAAGSNAGGSDVDRLSNLWATAPNVKDVFR
jgi:hypothetical protein